MEASLVPTNSRQDGDERPAKRPCLQAHNEQIFESPETPVEDGSDFYNTPAAMNTPVEINQPPVVPDTVQDQRTIMSIPGLDMLANSDVDGAEPRSVTFGRQDGLSQVVTAQGILPTTPIVHDSLKVVQSTDKGGNVSVTTAEKTEASVDFNTPTNGQDVSDTENPEGAEYNTRSATVQETGIPLSKMERVRTEEVLGQDPPFDVLQVESRSTTPGGDASEISQQNVQTQEPQQTSSPMESGDIRDTAVSSGREITGLYVNECLEAAELSNSMKISKPDVQGAPLNNPNGEPVSVPKVLNHEDSKDASLFDATNGQAEASCNGVRNLEEADFEMIGSISVADGKQDQSLDTLDDATNGVSSMPALILEPQESTLPDADPHPTGQEWEVDSDPYQSSSSSVSTTSSEGSSDETDEDGEDDFQLLSPTEQVRILMQEERGSDDEGPDDSSRKPKDPTANPARLRTQNEQVEEPIPIPNITLGPDSKITPLGVTEGIIENTMLVKASVAGDYQVLEVGSVLCLPDKTVIGVVAETLGRVQQPLYTVRFPSSAAIEERGLSVIDTEIFYVDSHSSFVFTQALKGVKGSDASNIHDEEIGDHEMEFSDDEKEAEYKRQLKMKKQWRRDERDGFARPPRGGIRMNGGESSHVLVGSEIRYDDIESGTVKGEEEGYRPLTRPSNLHEMMGNREAPQEGWDLNNRPKIYSEAAPSRGHSRGGFKGGRGRDNHSGGRGRDRRQKGRGNGRGGYGAYDNHDAQQPQRSLADSQPGSSLQSSYLMPSFSSSVPPTPYTYSHDSQYLSHQPSVYSDQHQPPVQPTVYGQPEPQPPYARYPHGFSESRTPSNSQPQPYSQPYQGSLFQTLGAFQAQPRQSPLQSSGINATSYAGPQRTQQHQQHFSNPEMPSYFNSQQHPWVQNQGNLTGAPHQNPSSLSTIAAQEVTNGDGRNGLDEGITSILRRLGSSGTG